ncbi:hypothetical protein ASE12_10590 [Aeromicrobium sp. Root236]|uniref:DUF6571 family protein n=1 Tax=Aeromicrobium sp. Root236 TaxID=1736498 RepID=UPI0006FC02CE|nr:DUF6571 family protein [Aeromicrobium sp. Root236]KRC65173.1 hypothetical protein ASE12_10590 [Aeromicrobium sp. Root236]
MALMPFEKHPADTGTMTASASTLEQKAAKCLDQKEITDKAYNPAVDSWEGICAPELRAAPKPIRDSAATANKQLAWSAVPINYAVGKVKAFNAKIGGFEADSEKPEPEGGHPTQTNKSIAMAAYREAYETDIVDGFSEAAGMFKDGPTDENIALAKAAGAIPNAPVFTVFGQLWHEDNVKKAVTEADKLIQQISDGKYTDMKTPLGPLVDLLKKYGTDQMFAAMLLNKIGPDGMLRLNQIVAQSESDTKPDDYGNKDGGPRDNALGDLIGQFQKSLGITLGTATGGQDGYEPGTRDDYRLDGDFTERLNELGREKSTIKWPGDDDLEYGTELYGYQVLAPLLKNGEFSSDFLTDVGNGMYYFDKGDGEHGGGPWMDTVANLRSDHGIRLDWTEGTGSTHAAGFDPMNGLMTALGNNPQASHDFFTDSRSYMIDGKEGHDQDVGYNEKLRYLLNERHWGLPNDQPYMGDGTDKDGYYDKKLWEEQNNTHAMDPLGKALTAATGLGDRDSATLFGDVVYEVSHGDSDKFGDLRDDFSNMATQHLGGINSAFIGDGGAGPDGDIDPITKGVQYDPGFSAMDDLDLEKFLAEIGKDHDAATHLTAAEGLYMQAGYHHYAGLDGSIEDRIAAIDANVNTPLGHVLGALDYGSSEQTFDDHQESDKEHNDGVDDKYKIIGFFTDKLPFDKIPVGGDLVKEGVGAYLDALKESEHIDTTAVANQLIGSLHSGSENHIQTTAEMTLYASLSDQDLAQFGDKIPRSSDGSPKPLGDWTAQDQAIFNQGVRDPAMAKYFTQFGQDARDAYSQAFDGTKTDLKSH